MLLTNGSISRLLRSFSHTAVSFVPTTPLSLIDTSVSRGFISFLSTTSLSRTPNSFLTLSAYETSVIVHLRKHSNTTRWSLSLTLQSPGISCVLQTNFCGMKGEHLPSSCIGQISGIHSFPPFIAFFPFAKRSFTTSHKPQASLHLSIITDNSSQSKVLLSLSCDMTISNWFCTVTIFGLFQSL